VTVGYYRGQPGARRKMQSSTAFGTASWPWGRVRRKPATARISSEPDVMQIGVAGLFLGGRVEPGSGFCFGSGVL